MTLNESWYDTLPTFPPGVSLSYSGECGENGEDPPVLELRSWKCPGGICTAHLVQKICGDPTETEYEVRNPVRVGRGYLAMLNGLTCACGKPFEYEVHDPNAIPGVFEEAFADA